MTYYGQYIPKIIEISYGEANLAGTLTDEKIYLTGLQGYVTEYPVKFNGTITQWWFSFDNSDGNYTAWSSGTLQIKILVNGSVEYTGPVWTKSSYDASITYSNADVKIINTNLSIPVVVGDLITVTFTTSSFVPSNTADITTNLVLE